MEGTSGSTSLELERRTPIAWAQSLIDPELTRETIEGMTRLPNQAQFNSQISLQTARLLYLTQAKGTHASLLEKKHSAVIRTDKWCGRQTLGFLVGCFALSFVIAPVAFINFVALKSDWSQAVQIAVISTVSTLGTAALGTMGFYATGFAPHFSSNASNSRQDMLHSMKREFKQMAEHLVALSAHEGDYRTFAKEIVEELDVSLIQEALNKQIGSEEAAKAVFAPLRTVVDHLRAENPSDSGYSLKQAVKISNYTHFLNQNGESRWEQWLPTAHHSVDQSDQDG